jgi:hypothetical protein
MQQRGSSSAISADPMRRKVGVNFALELRVLDRLDEECGGKGKRSAYVEKILKKEFRMD